MHQAGGSFSKPKGLLADAALISSCFQPTRQFYARPDLMDLYGVPCSLDCFHNQVRQFCYLVIELCICIFSANILNQHAHCKSHLRTDFKPNLITTFTVFLIPFKGSKILLCLTPRPTPPPYTIHSPFISVSSHFAAFSSMVKIFSMVLTEEKKKYCEGL